MAEIEDGQEQGPEKVTKQYQAGVTSRLDGLWSQADQSQRDRIYEKCILTQIYDDYRGMAVRHLGEAANTVLQPWADAEKKLGGPIDDLNGGNWKLEAVQYRELKAALVMIREKLGMGTTAPDGDMSRQISAPVRMAEFYQCPAYCIKLKQIKDSRRTRD